MENGLISINGEITPSHLAKISPLDRGFLFSDNVFEVIVAFGNYILDFEPHLARLRRSAALIELEIPWKNEELRFELQALVDQLGAAKTYLRLVVTRGNGIGLDFPSPFAPSRMLYAFAAAPLKDSVYSSGIALLPTKNHKNEKAAEIKTGNYLFSILALEKAKKLGFDDVLFYSSNGEVQEASTANIFFLGRDQEGVEIVTPPLKSGLLRGITRDRIIDKLADAGIRVEERIIHEDELPRFDEAFLCSTVKGLVPVSRIGEQRFYTTRNESLFKLVEGYFLKGLYEEIGRKVSWNTGKAL